jgi:hypothetical protein
MTPENSRTLMLYVFRRFEYVINTFFRVFVNKIDTCTEVMSVPNSILLNNKNKAINYESKTVANKFAKKIDIDKALITLDDFNSFFSKNNIQPLTDDPRSPNEEMPKIKERIDLILAENNQSIDKIKHEFEACSHYQYFIPLTVYKIHSRMSHQNLLLFNKQDKVVTWIEPQYDVERYPEHRENKPVYLIIRDLINKLLAVLIEDEAERKQYSIDMPSGMCPQSVTLDYNCVSWTVLLALTMVLNPNYTIDEASRAIIYETKDKRRTDIEVGQIINNFKCYLFDYFRMGGQNAGKRRKTNKSKLNNRKTRRNKK